MKNLDTRIYEYLLSRKEFLSIRRIMIGVEGQYDRTQQENYKKILSKLYKKGLVVPGNSFIKSLTWAAHKDAKTPIPSYHSRLLYEMGKNGLLRSRYFVCF